jgi:hypothetical protein
VCLIHLIHVIQLIQHNSALIYGILGTIEVLFLTTFITLRSNFINDARNAYTNAYSYHFAGGTHSFTIEKKWRDCGDELLEAATSRTYSLNLSIWGFVIFLSSLGMHILSGGIPPEMPHSPLSLISFIVKANLLIAATALLIISSIFLILAIANFIFNRNAKYKGFSWIPGAKSNFDDMRYR